MSSKLQKVLIFAKVCESQSILEAAREFDLSEPAIVEIIFQLESEAGGKLLSYSDGQFQVTEMGEAILANARAVTDLFSPR